MTNSIKHRIEEDVKIAMRAKDKARLEAIRFLMAAIKQREVDERITLNDEQVLAVVEKSIKQHRDSIEQYQKASRQDLVDKETFELTVLQAYMPEPLSEEAVDARIQTAIQAVQATSVRDMGKVMNMLRPEIQGRADMSAVSAKIKSLLSQSSQS